MKHVAGVALSVLSMVAVAAYAADAPKKLDGYVSDAMCGAKHASGDAAGQACVKKCIGGGEKPVFVDSAKKEVWSIDNPDAVKSAYGKHVSVMATADESAKSVHITKVSVVGE